MRAFGRELLGTCCQWLAVVGVLTVVGIGVASLTLFAGWPQYVTYPLGFVAAAVPAWKAWRAVGRHWGLE